MLDVRRGKWLFQQLDLAGLLLPMFEERKWALCAVGTSQNSQIQYRQRGGQRDRLKIAPEAQVSAEPGGGETKTHDVKWTGRKEAWGQVDRTKRKLWNREIEWPIQKTAWLCFVKIPTLNNLLGTLMGLCVKHAQHKELKKKETSEWYLIETLILVVNPGESSRPVIYFLIYLSSCAVYHITTVSITTNLSYLPRWQIWNE